MNIINRDNYETFFLLYADNELSVAERNAVDEFVQANADLQEELIMLQQSIVKPDHIVFEDKKSLFKNEIIATRIREKLLSRLDDELTTSERNEIDGLINADANIKKEWSILQQVKLSPDTTIVFKDKQSLYKKEPGRLVSFTWRRVAVAAVFIGFGAWGGWLYLHTDIKVANKGIAKNTNTKTIYNTVKQIARQPEAPVKISGSVGDEAIASNQEINTKVLKEKYKPSPKKTSPRAVTNRNMETIAINEKTNNLPKPYFDNINNIGSNKTINAYVTPEKQNNKIAVDANNDIENNTGIGDAAKIYANTASYTDNNADNNNRVLFMNEEKIKKTKLGGIFKKVKRIIERGTNIKPGSNNIKVANLQFAIQ